MSSRPSLDVVHTGEKESIIGEICVHLFFLAYLFLAFLPDNQGLMSVQYTVNALLIFLMLGFLFLNKDTFTQSIDLLPLVVFSVGCFSLFFVSLIDLNINMLLLHFKGFLIAYLLLINRTPFSSILKIINFYYLVYAALSVIFWLDLMPFHHLPYIKNDFLVNYLFIEYYVLFSFEGSPTLIGAYSFFIALINILFSGNHKTVILALVCGLLSFRNTPLVAFIIVLFPYLMFQSRRLMLTITILALASFLIICFYVSFSPYQDEGFDQFLYKVTHARNMLWGQFINLMLGNYTWVEYLFGGFSSDIFLVPAYQENGEFSGKFITNPHSDMLLFFLKWPAMTVLYVFLLFHMLLKAKNVKYTTVVLYIILISMMNSDILSIRNPVYLIVFCSLFVCSEHRFVATQSIKNHRS